MQLFNASKLPVYLPYDTATVPFGDPFSDVAYTAATPSVLTVQGYTPQYGQRVSLSANGGATLDTNFATGQAYYVTSVTTAAGTFSVATSQNGSPIQSYTTQGTTGNITIHLLSQQVDGTFVPFKTSDTVVAMNLTTATVYLNGAPDKNTTTYGNPTGPGTYTNLAAIPSLQAALVQLSQDWIVTTSAGPGNLVLLQN